MLYAGALMCTVAAIFSSVLPAGGWQIVLPLAIYLATFVCLGHMAGYLRPMDRVIERRRRNSLLMNFARYASQCLSTRASNLTPDEVIDMARRELNLCYLDARVEESQGVHRRQWQTLHGRAHIGRLD